MAMEAVSPKKLVSYCRTQEHLSPGNYPSLKQLDALARRKEEGLLSRFHEIRGWINFLYFPCRQGNWLLSPHL